MSRWKSLPTESHPQVQQLIVRLRVLKDRSGLSTLQLATKTGYSARSWQRYLNGRTLPPQEAVEAMARICGVDPVRLLVLHETAAEHWAEQQRTITITPGPHGSDTSTPTDPTATSRRSYGTYPRVLVMSGAVALVLSVSLSLLLAVRLADARAQLTRARTETVVATPATVSESLVPVVYTCRPQRSDDGLWHAGLSRTMDTILAYTHVGPEVAEAQCLLRRVGTSPGDIDGVFGPKTQRAVIRLQTRAGLVVDGVIGPHTWQALREADPT
ncbi:peptidoglycan-binding protein [Streptomyces sp. NPDC050400]|uniref:peptidoglycan-binding protein n=1 Tax=Streptomyces sp. NPDC050400 TaxID=3365610 RepID=UPI003791C265